MPPGKKVLVRQAARLDVVEIHAVHPVVRHVLAGPPEKVELELSRIAR
jgi:hypothetical protein